jgi:hypothetical protein
MGRNEMRRTLAAILITLGACGPTPRPTPEQPTSVPSATAIATPATRTPPAKPTAASPAVFAFDVENHASIGVVVSVASDTAATLPAFEPRQRGTIEIPLGNPQNGISVEIQGTECRLLASAMYPTPSPFTLLVVDGSRSGSVKLSTRPGASATPIPLPSNSLRGCTG